MDPLPTANTEITQFFRQWLETFAGYVREVDYASARPLFHPDVLAFGTYNDVISGIDQWVATQWDNIWPKTTDFRFVLEQTSVLASPDGMMATVIAPWLRFVIRMNEGRVYLQIANVEDPTSVLDLLPIHRTILCKKSASLVDRADGTFRPIYREAAIGLPARDSEHWERVKWRWVGGTISTTRVAKSREGC